MRFEFFGLYWFFVEEAVVSGGVAGFCGEFFVFVSFLAKCREVLTD